MTWCGVGLLRQAHPISKKRPSTPGPTSSDLDRSSRSGNRGGLTPCSATSSDDSIAAFLVVVLTSMITFAVFFFGPSNPADLICQQGGHCTAEKQQRIEHELGLDQSVVSQYGTFVKGLFVDREIEAGGTYHCDAPCLGISYSTKLEVRKEMTKRYPVTIWIAVGGVHHLPQRRRDAGCAGRALARHRHRQVPGDRQPVAQRGPVLRGLPASPGSTWSTSGAYSRTATTMPP